MNCRRRGLLLASRREGDGEVVTHQVVAQRGNDRVGCCVRSDHWMRELPRAHVLVPERDVACPQDEERGGVVPESLGRRAEIPYIDVNYGQRLEVAHRSRILLVRLSERRYMPVSPLFPPTSSAARRPEGMLFAVRVLDASCRS